MGEGTLAFVHCEQRREDMGGRALGDCYPSSLVVVTLRTTFDIPHVLW